MGAQPGIFFFPLCEPIPVGLTGMEQGVLARRIPDFLCICLNDNGLDRAGLLEIRAADEHGVPTGDWASFDEPPDPDDIQNFLPGNDSASAIVGTIKPYESIAEDSATSIELELTLIRAGGEAERVQWRLDLDDPGGSCVKLARTIAQRFRLPLSERTWRRFGTSNPRAFLHFLRGLDGAATLDPELIGMRDPRSLLEPFVAALREDPDFGFALRRLHVALHEAVMQFSMRIDDARDLLDEAYSTMPSDTEAAANIGEHLAAIGEEDRAEDWLRLAVQTDEPQANALETLGILLANRGDTVQARNLWLTGVRTDGDPDFFGHLARLAFEEGEEDEAWDKVLRGLRRIAERRLHPGEWGDEEGRGGVVLRYLSEQLEERLEGVPADVAELLVDLVPQISEPDDRLDLGLCLAQLGMDAEAEQTLQVALPHLEDSDRRDRCAERLAHLKFTDFDQELEFCATAEGDDLPKALTFLSEVTTEIPQFWPAHYFRGRCLERLGDLSGSFDALTRASRLRRDQPELFHRLAICAGRLGRLESAITAMETAIELDPGNPELLAEQAVLLLHAGREDEAREALEAAETLDPEADVVRQAREMLDEGNS